MPNHFCRFVALLIAIRKRKRKNGHFSCLVPMAYGCGTNGTKETRPTSPLQFAKQAKCFDVCNRATKDTQHTHTYLQIVCVALDRVVLLRSFLSDELMTSYVELAKVFHGGILEYVLIFLPPPRVLANCPCCPVGLPSHDIDKYQATGLHGIVWLDKFYRL